MQEVTRYFMRRALTNTCHSLQHHNDDHEHIHRERHKMHADYSHEEHHRQQVWSAKHAPRTQSFVSQATAFMHYDRNQDGRLSHEEFTTARGDHGAEMHTTLNFQRHDKNEDNFIDLKVALYRSLYEA